MSTTCPNCDDTLATIHELVPRQMVKVAGEWQEIVSIDRTEKKLLLQPRTLEGHEWGRIWQYEVLPGEVLTTVGSF
jgi:hypothetical protein